MIQDGYELLDSGGEAKLERFGDVVLARPCAQAVWKPQRKALWQTADAIFDREGGNHWHGRSRLPKEWTVRVADIAFRLSGTDFGHLGIFPEQRAQWQWIRETLRAEKAATGRTLNVLNLFAYTGAASLAARAAGADVTHLDSVRQVVTWARGNMENSGLDGIRWVVEDAMKFARREARRGNLYDGIILDPPAYGHGPDGEKWKLDECLFEMLRTVDSILRPERSFVVLNLYSNGYSALLGETLVRQAFRSGGLKTESAERQP